VLWLLAACLALQASGMGINLPVFARRLEAFGAGPELLSLMTIGFAAAQFLFAPLAGGLADRYGRKPVVLAALAGFAAANLAFVLAPDPRFYVGVRVFEGALGAGLLPAGLGIVGDVAPDEGRAGWIGVVSGSAAAGLVFGPVLGGVLYDLWGFAAPFGLSAALAAIALGTAAAGLPETRRTGASVGAAGAARSGSATGARPRPPGRPLRVFLILLLLDFTGAFAAALVQPVLAFYFYDGLRYTTVQFGIVLGVYGLAAALGQALLPRVGGRVGRAPLIALGFLLSTAFYVGLSQLTQFAALVVVAVVAGVGGALVAPALGSLYLDVTEERLRSRAVGIKGSATALAGVLGPLLVVAALRVTAPRGIFVAAGGLTALAAAISVVALRGLPSSDGSPRDASVEQVASPSGGFLARPAPRPAA
jgi:DHA1 family tetracycline resistance protein-like MFS transporter